MWVLPGAGCFTIERGEGSLKDYEFGKCSMSHKFCPTCGTGVIAKKHSVATGMDVWVNARALQDVDLWSLTKKKFDGLDFEPPYNPPRFTGPEPIAEIDTGKLYTGSCHCGAVTLALKTKGPLSKESEVIGECNCSICSRKGTIVTYRPPTQISISLTPGTSLSTYAFGPKRFVHKFCPVCGVAVGTDDINNLRNQDLTAVNLRCFEDVEWEDIRVWREDGKREEPKYTVPV